MKTHEVEIEADNRHHAREAAALLASDAGRRFFEAHGVVPVRVVRAQERTWPEPEDLEMTR